MKGGCGDRPHHVLWPRPCAGKPPAVGLSVLLSSSVPLGRKPVSAQLSWSIQGMKRKECLRLAGSDRMQKHKLENSSLCSYLDDRRIVGSPPGTWWVPQPWWLAEGGSVLRSLGTPSCSACALCSSPPRVLPCERRAPDSQKGQLGRKLSFALLTVEPCSLGSLVRSRALADPGSTRGRRVRLVWLSDGHSWTLGPWISK